MRIVGMPRTLHLVCAAALGALGCHAPTLWIGTALSPDGGEALGVAGEGQPPALQPEAAGVGEVGGHSSETQGGTVPVRASAAGAEPHLPQGAAGVDAGVPSLGAPDAGSDQAPSDEDAGSDPTPDAPELATPSALPRVEGTCPRLNGTGSYAFSGGGRSLMVDIHMRADARSLPTPGGPLIMYFHSLGGVAGEVVRALGQSTIDAVVAQGGVVASFSASPCLRCGLADDVVWYDEDDAVSDQVVACAIEQARVDPRRIHSVGFSSGALHSMHLALARSSYIASVVSYSGGLPAGSLDPQDPANKVPALLAYGREGVDSAVVDFNVASRDWRDRFAPLGYYVLLCDHQGGHEIPTDLVPHVSRFLQDHPYRVDPEPYAMGIPDVLPMYCQSSP